MHMNEQSKTDWVRIDALRDEDIDYSDNPRLASDFFDQAVQWPDNKELEKMNDSKML